jgi:exopolyphosphatase / guanosine-5'-triphosphate,3'-diphosphate pyrophosphatase
MVAAADASPRPQSLRATPSRRITCSAVRVAVVDIGTNSTRLLVAEVGGDGRVTELERRTTITRLGQGVDASGVLAEEAMGRVLAALARYRELIDPHGATRTFAVLTSAVRDAANGPAFAARVREEYGLDARTIPGDEEARLTFLGATSERPAGDATPTVVIDIGGGSTEFVVGARREVAFHASTQAGVVRQSERVISSDPPTRSELDALAAEAREIFAASLPSAVRARVEAAIAVAGTATSLGAIDLDLERYDAAKVHGHRLPLRACEAILDRLAALPEAERRAVRGLHPDRAPTIVAGAVLLIEALRTFGLDATEVSDHDILRGAALQAAQRSAAGGAPAAAS